ncbi:hypothetical protein [Nonomuraea aridisoli]|nr:hypothetical protein [Nonomuraea aridisoli]
MAEAEYEGDLHWYDLPDDECEPDEAATGVHGLVRRLLAWRSAPGNG